MAQVRTTERFNILPKPTNSSSKPSRSNNNRLDFRSARQRLPYSCCGTILREVLGKKAT